MTEAPFPSALRLIEDALVLVKRADAATWLIYVSGVVPFFALLIYAVTDLLASPFAAEELAPVSFGLAFAYLWMHVCQSVFCSRLYAIESESGTPEGAQVLAAVPVQSVLAATKLIAWPLAFVVLIPHPSVSMFYQHSLLPGELQGSSWRSTLAAAREDGRYKLGQAAWALAVFFLLRIILIVNLFALLLTLPQLWKAFTGFENDITRWPPLLANPVAQLAICALAYVALDPLVKAACVLRRLERESIRSGVDLRLRLRQLQGAATLVLLLGLTLVPSAFAQNQEGAKSDSGGPRVTPAQMTAAVCAVFRDPAGTWNLPIVQEKKPQTNPVFAFIDSVSDHLGKGWDRFKAWLRNLVERANQRQPPRKDHGQATSGDVWLLVGLFAGVLGVAVLFAWWRSRKQSESQPADARTVPGIASVDLSKDDVQADERPQDEWMALAREHRTAGNLRFSLRALYLSSLATLARASLITVARGKSNLDYFRELQRRGKRLSPDMVSAFRSNLGMFEETWYGDHPVTEPVLEAFEQNLVVVQELIPKS